MQSVISASSIWVQSLKSTPFPLRGGIMKYVKGTRKFAIVIVPVIESSFCRQLTKRVISTSKPKNIEWPLEKKV